MKNRNVNRLVTAMCLFMMAIAIDAQVTVTGSMLGPLRARSIGPAVMSGRVSDIAVVDTASRRFYVGAAGGGVWKTTDGGVTFKPVFDEYPQSIGAITIDQKRPDTVWVGTGESWTRNSVSVGEGVFRTTDAGRTWTKAGLDSTERIARIVISPKDPNTVYAAVPGPLFSDSEHRGLYKTTDFGGTWTKVLTGDARTGCSDVIIDQKNPKILVASMWSFRRTPYSFVSGGPGSGIFRSVDGGTTWTRMVKGLPTGDLGRIALAVSPVDSKLMYASVEAKESAMYKSTDGGISWERRYVGSVVDIRPFYFSRLVCDPKNKDVLYKCGIQMYRSDDGGLTFTIIAQSAHSDHHAVWIDPSNTQHILLGTDGGVNESFEQGKTVRFLQNLPVGQFYHVTVDEATPFNVYGGLQDNGSWRGPSNADGGISNGQWLFVGGGDGFHVAPERGDANVVYWESQGGNINRTNLRSKETKNVAPTPDDGSLKLRYNWNSPIIRGSSQGVIYVGSQYVHRSTDRGDTWKRISPDLTTNDSTKLNQGGNGGITLDNSSAENHCTIYTIVESPIDDQSVWVGTDDGNLQRTTDGGATWKNYSSSITGVPQGAWVTSIEPSPHDAATCFATFDGHMRGDMRPYVYRTNDNGKSWSSIVTADIKGYAHTIRQDPVQPRILYLGTESGLWISLDGGTSWASFRNNLPPVAVRGIAFQNPHHAVALATHGRGMYVIDNLDILRALDPRSINEDLTVLPTVPAVRSQGGGAGRWFGGDADYVGESKSESAVVWYFLKERHVRGTFTIAVKDSAGTVIRSVPGSSRKGLNSVELAMRGPAPLTANSEIGGAFGSLMGPLLPEGVYTVELNKAGLIKTTPITVVTDTAYGHSIEDRHAQEQLVAKLYALSEELAVTVGQVRAGRDTLKTMQRDQAVIDTLDAFYKRLVNTKVGQVTGEEQLRERLSSLFGEVNGYLGHPTSSQETLALALEVKVKEATTQAQEILGPYAFETRAQIEDRLRRAARTRK
ncbi:MAG: glycosyl hydrolase [Candidatus Kapabacteria bacterium]|nr:glycosyl hydrolase [Candidatus Kapabacteria bacterium]